MITNNSKTNKMMRIYYMMNSIHLKNIKCMGIGNFTLW